MQKLLISLAVTTSLSLSLSLSGCSTVGDGLSQVSSITSWVPDALDKAPLIYRPTIQQGNVVTQEQVNQLKPGMSRRQVRFVLGSPTLTDVFHEDRWDYPFTIGFGSKPETFKYLSVYFEDDRLVRITGDLHPQPEAEQKPVEKPSLVSVPDWTPESKSLFGRAVDAVTSVGFGSD